MVNKNEENLNIIDYVNNKFDKLVNFITSYNSYKFGAMVGEGNLSLTATDTPLTLKNNLAYFGNTDFFKINDDNIEVLLPVVENDLGLVNITFTTCFRANNFTPGETLWARIRVAKADGTLRKVNIQSVTVTDTNSRNELSTSLPTTLEKGDKIYFEISIDNAKTVNVSKTSFLIDYQQQLPTDFYKFLY